MIEFKPEQHDTVLLCRTPLLMNPKSMLRTHRAISRARSRSFCCGSTSFTQAHALCLLRRYFLPGQQKIASAVRIHQQWHHDVHAIARNHAAREMRRVLEKGVIGGKHDVREEWDFRMPHGRPVDRCYDGSLNS